MEDKDLVLSQQIKLENLSNTRDLGGMIGADGRKIKAGKLIRSSLLSRASDADLEKLAQMLSAVVDFRSDGERKLQADPELPGVENVPLPAVADVTPGVTRDEDSLKAVLTMMNDPEKARAHMIQTYRDIITSEFSLGQYGRFFRILLEGHEKAVLWHCTAGKDRAGMGAFFVEKALGVSDEAVFADYMKSNDYLAKEVEEIVATFTLRGETTHPEAIGYMFGAKEEFLETVETCIRETYGDYDTFFRDGLRLREADLEKLRDMYLEP